MQITNREFHSILTLVISELIFLEQRGRESEPYYHELVELKRKLMILNNVKKG